MASLYGPRIITDGLVCYLDAANTKSYPGTGTIWYDLSGYNHNATLVNGPTYNSNYKGAFKFDGADDYATINSTAALTFTTPTIIAFCTNNTGGVIAKGGYGSYWNYGIKNITSTSFMAINNNGNTTNPSSFPSISSSFPVCCAVNWDGTNINFYRNGFSGGASSAAYSPSANNSLFLRIGCLWNQLTSSNVEFYSGSIYSIMIYNRALSLSEINQNYNAIKGRFNL